MASKNDKPKGPVQKFSTRLQSFQMARIKSREQIRKGDSKIKSKANRRSSSPITQVNDIPEKLDESGDNSPGTSTLSDISNSNTQQDTLTAKYNLPKPKSSLHNLRDMLSVPSMKRCAEQLIPEHNVQRVQLMIKSDFCQDRTQSASVASTRPIPTMGQNCYRHNMINRDRVNDWFLELNGHTDSLESQSHSLRISDVVSEVGPALDHACSLYGNVRNPTLVYDATSIVIEPNKQKNDDNTEINKQLTISELNVVNSSGSYQNNFGNEAADKDPLQNSAIDTRKHESVTNRIENDSSIQYPEPKKEETSSRVKEKPTAILEKIAELLEQKAKACTKEHSPYYKVSISESSNHNVPVPSYVDCPSEVLQKTTNFEGTDHDGPEPSPYSLLPTDNSLVEDRSELPDRSFNNRHSQSHVIEMHKSTSTAAGYLDSGLDYLSTESSDNRLDPFYRWEIPKRLHSDYCKNCHNYRRFPSSRYQLPMKFTSWRQRISLRRICRKRWQNVWHKTTAHWCTWSKSARLKKLRMMDYLQRSIAWEDAHAQTNILQLQDTGTDAVAIEQKSAALSAIFAEGTCAAVYNKTKSDSDDSSESRNITRSKPKHVNLGPSMFPFLYNSKGNSCPLQKPNETEPVTRQSYPESKKARTLIENKIIDVANLKKSLPIDNKYATTTDKMSNHSSDTVAADSLSTAKHSETIKDIAYVNAPLNQYLVQLKSNLSKSSKGLKPIRQTQGALLDGAVSKQVLLENSNSLQTEPRTPELFKTGLMDSAISNQALLKNSCCVQTNHHTPELYRTGILLDTAISNQVLSKNSNSIQTEQHTPDLYRTGVDILSISSKLLPAKEEKCISMEAQASLTPLPVVKAISTGVMTSYCFLNHPGHSQHSIIKCFDKETAVQESLHFKAMETNTCNMMNSVHRIGNLSQGTGFSDDYNIKMKSSNIYSETSDLFNMQPDGLLYQSEECRPVNCNCKAYSYVSCAVLTEQPSTKSTVCLAGEECFCTGVNQDTRGVDASKSLKTTRSIAMECSNDHDTAQDPQTDQPSITDTHDTLPQKLNSKDHGTSVATVADIGVQFFNSGGKDMTVQRSNRIGHSQLISVRNLSAGIDESTQSDLRTLRSGVTSTPAFTTRCTLMTSSNMYPRPVQVPTISVQETHYLSTGLNVIPPLNQSRSIMTKPSCVCSADQTSEYSTDPDNCVNIPETKPNHSQCFQFCRRDKSTDISKLNVKNKHPAFNDQLVSLTRLIGKRKATSLIDKVATNPIMFSNLDVNKWVRKSNSLDYQRSRELRSLDLEESIKNQTILFSQKSKGSLNLSSKKSLLNGIFKPPLQTLSKDSLADVLPAYDVEKQLSEIKNANEVIEPTMTRQSMKHELDPNGPILKTLNLIDEVKGISSDDKCHPNLIKVDQLNNSTNDKGTSSDLLNEIKCYPYNNKNHSEIILSTTELPNQSIKSNFDSNGSQIDNTKQLSKQISQTHLLLESDLDVQRKEIDIMHQKLGVTFNNVNNLPENTSPNVSHSYIMQNNMHAVNKVMIDHDTSVPSTKRKVSNASSKFTISLKLGANRKNKYMVTINITNSR